MKVGWVLDHRERLLWPIDDGGGLWADRVTDCNKWGSRSRLRDEVEKGCGYGKDKSKEE